MTVSVNRSSAKWMSGLKKAILKGDPEAKGGTCPNFFALFVYAPLICNWALQLMQTSSTLQVLESCRPGFALEWWCHSIYFVCDITNISTCIILDRFVGPPLAGAYDQGKMKISCKRSPVPILLVRSFIVPIMCEGHQGRKKAYPDQFFRVSKAEGSKTAKSGL